MTSTSTESSDRARSGSWPRGLALGLVLGLAVWAAYFLQATQADWFSWEVSVVPAVGLLAVAAGVTAAVRDAARSTWSGVAIGVVLAVPLVLGTFVLLAAFVFRWE
jgi:hypothetical protein